MTKIFIATPAYAGTVTVSYAVSLAETKSMLDANNIGNILRISTSNALLVFARNQLIEGFMGSDCTHMLCLDADIGWPPSSVMSLINHDEEFVAGVYPSRKPDVFNFRPMFKEDKSLVYSEKKLVQMEYIPAGFMLLKRSAIEKMRRKFPELFVVPKSPDKSSFMGYCLFNTEVWDGQFWGEDYVFCHRAREAGVEIWVDPFIEFYHAGQKGTLAQTFTTEKQKSI